MDTRLQSNEIRIPKPAFDLKLANGNSGVDSGGVGGAASAADTCHHYFRSSFARSLSSFGSTKSLDFGINYGFQNKFTSIEEVITDGEGSPTSLPPALLSIDSIDAAGGSIRSNMCDDEQMRTSSLSSSTATLDTVKNVWTGDNAQAMIGVGSNGQQQQAQSVGKCNGNKFSNRPSKCAGTASMCDTSEIEEVLRLRKECQNLIEENRRLLNLANVVPQSALNSMPSNVEAVILQNQVDTLQWQLNQVESSRQMYRAVMEEVVRFLERCHHSLDVMSLAEPISRSKSTYHVHATTDAGDHANDNEPLDHNSTASSSPIPSTPSGLLGKSIFGSRARCSTIDMPKLLNRNQTNSATIQSAGSYSNFRDFTWRRNQKPLNHKVSNMELEPDKLSQEAFRLLRTASNLLHTQEPVLIKPKVLDSSNYSSPMPSPHLGHHHHTSHMADHHSSFGSFSRKSNGRQSSTSLRSICDTNSTASSNSSGSSHTKAETDEGCPKGASSPSGLSRTAGMTTSAMNGHHHYRQMQQQHHHHHQQQMMHSEAESGFSSISSFQEIGLPLITSSHMLSSRGSSASHGSDHCSSDDSNPDCMDPNLDVTVCQVQASEVAESNNCGLPAVPPRFHHRRCESTPALPPKNAALHPFMGSANGDETLRVLWV